MILALLSVKKFNPLGCHLDFTRLETIWRGSQIVSVLADGTPSSTRVPSQMATFVLAGGSPASTVCIFTGGLLNTPASKDYHLCWRLT